MKKYIARLFIITFAVLLVTLCGCKSDKSFDTEWIIGKNVYEITEKYGEFDKVFVSEGKPIRSGWYKVSEERESFFGRRYAVYLRIGFDENETAVSAVYHRGLFDI